MPIRLVKSDADLRACYPVMAQLRPHLTADQFLRRVRRQMRQGYRLALLSERGQVRCVAGYRILESLSWGRFLYVDDLVTDQRLRSKGHGRRMFDWLVKLARRQGCRELDLDSGVQRFDAHRFYLGRRMKIAHHHFTLLLED